jgi:hypothetical protein
VKFYPAAREMQTRRIAESGWAILLSRFRNKLSGTFHRYNNLWFRLIRV